MSKKSENLLLVREELPKWVLDNPYILKWFRKPNLNHIECLKSLFQIHNQTLNIWTHILGLVISQYYCLFEFPAHLSNVTDIFLMTLTYTGIMLSYFCSILYHIFNIGSSFELSCFLTKVDYFGIICHLIGCMLSLVYFVYYRNPIIQALYVGLYILVGAICLVMNYHSMFSSIANKNMNSSKRALFFVFVAFLSLPPQLIIVISYPWKIAQMAIFTDIAYLLAALVYAMKYPEKLCPGNFDLFNSHTIFHVIIIVAGLGSLHSLSMISKHEIDYNQIFT